MFRLTFIFFRQSYQKVAIHSYILTNNSIFFYWPTIIVPKQIDDIIYEQLSEIVQKSHWLVAGAVFPLIEFCIPVELKCRCYNMTIMIKQSACKEINKYTEITSCDLVISLEVVMWKRHDACKQVFVYFLGNWSWLLENLT